MRFCEVFALRKARFAVAAAGAVIELLKNAELRQTFGRRSYEKAREQFDAAALTKKLERLYIDVMSTSP